MPNFEISEVRDPLPGYESRARSAFSRALESVPVGKAIIVKGDNRSNIASRALQFGRRVTPNRRYTTNLLPDGCVQIVRTE